MGPTYCLQGSMIGRAEKNGPQGSGINDDICLTLNTIDLHAVAYPVLQHHPDNEPSERQQATMGRPMPLPRVGRTSSCGGDMS